MPFHVAPTQRLALAGSEKENKKFSLALGFFFLFIRLRIFFYYYYSELSNPEQILRGGAWPTQELPGVLLQVGFGLSR